MEQRCKELNVRKWTTSIGWIRSWCLASHFCKELWRVRIKVYRVECGKIYIRRHINLTRLQRSITCFLRWWAWSSKHKFEEKFLYRFKLKKDVTNFNRGRWVPSILYRCAKISQKLRRAARFGKQGWIGGINNGLAVCYLILTKPVFKRRSFLAVEYFQHYVVDYSLTSS